MLMPGCYFQNQDRLKLCHIIASIQGQDGWGSGQPSLVAGNQIMAQGLEIDEL